MMFIHRIGISNREHWKQAQSELYYQIADQLRTLWSNGSNGAALNSQNGAQCHVEPPIASEPIRGRHGSIGANPTIWSGNAELGTAWSGTATGRAKAGVASQNPLKGGE